MKFCFTSYLRLFFDEFWNTNLMENIHMKGCTSFYANKYSKFTTEDRYFFRYILRCDDFISCNWGRIKRIGILHFNRREIISIRTSKRVLKCIIDKNYGKKNKWPEKRDHFFNKTFNFIFAHKYPISIKLIPIIN